jgi:hypothetical protein
MPSWHPLSACRLRFAILAALAGIARLPGHGRPLAAVLKLPQDFNLRVPSVHAEQPVAHPTATVVAIVPVMRVSGTK